MHASSIVVTGGAGFIGSHIAKTFSDSHEVTVLDNLSTGATSRIPANAQFVEADIREEASLHPHFNSADVVFHQAALVSVDESIRDPKRSAAINLAGTMSVLETARRTDTRVVLASSAAIYGHPEDTPIDEDHPTHPTSPYGVDKLAVDHYARVYAELYDLETVALRYFNVYGPGQTGGNYAGVITVFIRQALAGEDITVHGDGEQTRDFVFVDDVVRANRLAAETDHIGKSYNIGTGHSVSIRRLAELIQDLTDTDSDIVHVESRRGDIDQSVADITAATNTLEYEPTVSLEEGLERTIDWYRSM